MQRISKIYVSAVESSGDLLGADLARALKKKYPNATLIGMGGERMQEAGVKIIFNPATLAIIGVSEIIKQLPNILCFFSRIKKYIATEKPDLVILIDSPDTHFRLFKKIKKCGIPILYYVSPQIWAWRAWRIRKIKKYVNHMAVLFSFEEKIYRDASVPVTFVGHPLATLVKPTMNRETAYHYFQLSPDKPIVTLFPGSRRSELKYHLPILKKTMGLITQKNPSTQFVVMLAPHVTNADVALLSPSVTIARDHLYDLLQITTAAIAASGTVTLEIALMQVPLCIFYQFSAFNYWIARLLIRTQYIGLCNIVAETEIAKEFIQANATPDNIAQEMLRLLNDENYCRTYRTQCGDLRNKITATKNILDIDTSGINNHGSTRGA
ncbi:MAG: hypothetical protein ACD_70C00052G0002 [uncultured bacterium]|nr:MAG: hypothetical protein ACD_70C00052G0002 [uncultured bacterium]OGT25145.1 MAG: lipid-A-disaccharide synthase [Gammaproteobacteria bacterium RIFCSPHIGHO2_02_FULL_42_43]OGT50968.1 MAG: lipid-A-disaccharide synthase [Gammaproteobacteria bacterium RIFCSPHIGHO2_12_FULL_41_25]OGT63058.1 MAG: lipid-A-disaccharide synthase [Gammaproteobacteria bacterium RIFCSPLOWO2_02_FULL_42_14]OGT85649.1 MAG: lipid-A-disaccharide synthase [Gammaproteobacteria bacterium RIFCSPLOWO2_12_FULL_42_18]